VAGILVVVVGSALALKTRMERREAEAASELGAALRTFRAYVGAPSPGSPAPDGETFTTAPEKYKKALDQFAAVVRKYPPTKSAAIALYHEGVCQSQLGDDAGAVKTLQAASGASDSAIASLAKLALADEMARTSKLSEAAKLYQDLADHPTLTVPRATALLEMAGAYRSTQPAQARRIYDELEKEFASDVALAQAIRQQVASQPHSAGELTDLLYFVLQGS
jgi:TolA-binding protein